jgi:hypothetical protein
MLIIAANSFVTSAYYEYGDDPENVESYKAGYPMFGRLPQSDQEIAVPTSLRTLAEQYTENTSSYAYYGNGGVSLAIPYAAGVLALGWQIKPDLDRQEIVAVLFETAYENSEGERIINPPLFIKRIKEMTLRE